MAPDLKERWKGRGNNEQAGKSIDGRSAVAEIGQVDTCTDLFRPPHLGNGRTLEYANKEGRSVITDD